MKLVDFSVLMMEIDIDGMGPVDYCHVGTESGAQARAVTNNPAEIQTAGAAP